MLTVDFSRLNLAANMQVLDLGCGEGRHALGLAAKYKNLRVFAIDININDLNTANTRKTPLNIQSPCYFIQGDGRNLPFENNRFDLVICSEVLEHIHQYQHFIAEIRRVMKPDAQLVISVPRFWPERICWLLEPRYHKVPGGHIRIFRDSQIKSAITDAGFDLKSHHWAHALHVPYWWLRCLFWNSGSEHFLVRTYHKMLVWDLFQKPWITQTLDKLLNPLMGKSLVLYFQKHSQS